MSTILYCGGSAARCTRPIVFVFDSEESLLVRDGVPCVVLWRPGALDCRVPYPSRGSEWIYP